MKNYILVLLFTLAATAVHSQKSVQDDNFLDFWIGNWEVSWPEGDGQGSGINKVEKILDNTTVLENFEVLVGQSKGMKGKSLSAYSAVDNCWKQSWVDNQNTFLNFTAEIVDGNPSFSTDIVQLGLPVTQRMVFKDITDDGFIWDWESSSDEGVSWTSYWTITYKRIEE